MFISTKSLGIPTFSGARDALKVLTIIKNCFNYRWISSKISPLGRGSKKKGG